MKHIDKFYLYLDELDHSYKRLAQLLQSKMEAVQKYDLIKLDAILKEEQVYVLLSKGFESNIHAHRDQLSLKGETLSAIISELPEDQKGRFQQQYKRLKTALNTVKDLNDKCQQLLENRLYSLDKSIKSLDKSDNTTYRSKAEPIPNAGSNLHILSQSV